MIKLTDEELLLIGEQKKCFFEMETTPGKNAVNLNRFRILYKFS